MDGEMARIRAPVGGGPNYTGTATIQSGRLSIGGTELTQLNNLALAVTRPLCL